MHLREKIGRLFMIGFDGKTPPESLIALIRDYFVGGVILYRRNIESKEQLKELISKIKTAAEGRPLLVAVDHEGGRVFRLPPPFTQWPPMAEMGLSPSFKGTVPFHRIYEVGKKMAEELKSVGFNVNFAPVLDVNTNIKNPVIGDRAFSSDASVVAELGVQLINGLQENGIIACGKHFPGHGDTALDSHTALPTLPHTLKRLESLELIPFIAAIASGVKSIMTAHVIYEGIDSKVPATFSPFIIKNLLCRQLGFRGVIFTDDLLMGAIIKKWPLPEACLRSLSAGCDICLISHDNAAQKEAIEYIISSANAGKLSEAMINASSNRALVLCQ